MRTTFGLSTVNALLAVCCAISLPLSWTGGLADGVPARSAISSSVDEKIIGCEGSVDYIRTQVVLSGINFKAQQFQSQNEAQISVGANIQVSKKRPTWPHDEVILSIDPTNPRRMIACSVVLIPEQAKRTTIIYATDNGGATWEPTLTADYFRESADPVCLFGPDGTAHFAIEGGIEVSPEVVDLYRSKDGGKTWLPRYRIPVTFQGYDRHFLTADETGGKYHSRLYMNAWTKVRSMDGDGPENVFSGFALMH